MSSEKHVMLSYQWDNQALVTDVYKRLHAENIPLWMDTQGGMKGHLSSSMAEAVENAIVVCCFLTPKYQDSVACKDELTYAKERRVSIIPIRLMKDWKPSGWLGFSITGLKYINFCDSATNMDLRINQLIAEIRMVAGGKQSSLPVLNWAEEDEKHQQEDDYDDAALTDQGTAVEKQRFDPKVYYRLTTQWQGDGKSLDIVNDGESNNQLILAQTGNYSGQHWKLTLLDDGYYRLTTKWQGEGKSLTVVEDGGSQNHLILAQTTADSSQYWRITLLKNNYYRLTSKWQDYDKSLDIINDGQNNKIALAKTGNYSGQYWRIAKV